MMSTAHIKKSVIPGLSVIVLSLLLVFFKLLWAGEMEGTETPILEPQQTQVIKALSDSRKLIAPQKILRDFIDGKSTTRVIVNLCKPTKADQLQNFKDMAVRQELRQTVYDTQERVINGLDPAEVCITNRFTYIFGFSAEVSLKGLEDLVNNNDVSFIEKDEIEHINLAQGIPLINASTPRSSYSGSGLAIAICDTGIDYSHSRLGGGGFPNSKIIGGYDCGDDDNDPMDQDGHGTACAGIAAGDLGTVGDYIGGVAYNAKLYALKISYGSGGSAYTSDMVEAWEWCVTHQNDNPSHRIMIISTSFGSGRYYSTCDSASATRTQAAANAVASGMTLFVSSGNEGYCDSIGTPACISHVISVGAVYDANLGRHPPSGYVGCISNDSCVGTPGPPCDEKWYVDEPAYADQVTTYSNSASILSLLAPSNWAYTTKLGGGFWDTANGFGGTSAACPYAAGAAACLQNAAKVITGYYLTPAQVKSTLINTGDLITDGKVSITKPRINLGSAVGSLGESSISYVEPSGYCDGNTPCYSTIQTAVDSAATGTTIKIVGEVYNEGLILNSDKNLTLKGGYDSAFTLQSSDTIANSLTIYNGKIIADHLVLQSGGTTTTTTIPSGSSVQFCTEASCSTINVTFGSQTFPYHLDCTNRIQFDGVPAGSYYIFASGCGIIWNGSLYVDGIQDYNVWLCPVLVHACCPSGCNTGGAFRCTTKCP